MDKPTYRDFLEEYFEGNFQSLSFLERDTCFCDRDTCICAHQKEIDKNIILILALSLKQSYIGLGLLDQILDR